jgi:hypothetical protein
MIFPRLMRVYVSAGFLASYWSAGFGTFLHVSALASHWLEDRANFTPRYKQQANPFLSMNNFIPLVISMNDKKQLTILSQCKLALTSGINFLRYRIIGKKLKTSRVP